MQPAQHLRDQFDRLIAEFIAATTGLIRPDPQLGADIRAAYEAEGEHPPLRVMESAA